MRIGWRADVERSFNPTEQPMPPASDLGHVPELQLTDYLAILRRRWPFVLGPLLLLILLSAANSVRQPQRFEASARVLVAPTAAGAAVNDRIATHSSSTRSLANAALLVESDRATDFVRAAHGNEVAEGRIDVATEPNSDVLVFTASAAESVLASQTANRWAESFVSLRALDGAVSLETVRADLETRIDSLLAQEQVSDLSDTDLLLLRSQIQAITSWITRLDAHSQIALEDAGRIIEHAQPPTTPTNSPLSRALLLGAVGGLIVGATAALLRENFDRAIRSKDDLRALGLTPLGEIPRAPRADRGQNLALWTATKPGSAVSAAYRQSVAMIRMEARLHSVRSILVTSALPNEGKSTTATNLAVGFAEAGEISALVDADLRRPSIANVFGIERPAAGLTDVIVERADLGSTAINQRVGDGWMAIVTAGTRVVQPSALLASDATGDIVKVFETEADFTVFDGPPVLPVSDALSLGPIVGGVVLVAEVGRTRRDDLRNVVQTMRASGSCLLGAILIGVNDSRLRERPRGAGNSDNPPIDLRRHESASLEKAAVRVPQSS